MLTKIGPAKQFAQSKPVKAARSIFSDLGGRSAEGVIRSQLTWTYQALQSGSFSLSLQNKLRENVKNVYCLVVFYDAQNNPLDVDVVRYEGIIPAGLAKRVTSNVDGSVQKLTTAKNGMTPKTREEFRILDFEIVN